MIIFEDQNILVVNKPSGIATLPEKGGVSLFEMLKNERSIFEINRIDKRVSGIVLFAKDKKSQVSVNKQIVNGKVRKSYKAVVGNLPNIGHVELTDYLIKIKDKAFVTSAENPKAKYAHLHFDLLISSEKYHLLEIELFTGRFHQIRCQLANYGCPILGDLKYGYKRSSPDGSIFLQCFKMEFLHPQSLETVIFEIPQPEIWSKYGF